MCDAMLSSICELIQEDVGKRGLRTDPNMNLVTVTSRDFEAACRSLARTESVRLAIVTGFIIPTAEPPAGETDGPLGAIFLARTLLPLGISVALATDSFCAKALRAGLAYCGLEKKVPVITLPAPDPNGHGDAADYFNHFVTQTGPLTHLLAIERVGPTHSSETIRAQAGSDSLAVEQFLREVEPAHYDRCHTMRGRDITELMSPAHRLFEECSERIPDIITIGIGDGGNEIGMGKIPWKVIRDNIPGGGSVACRIPTDFLIVSGISNWGAYGLAAGTYYLRCRVPTAEFFDIELERELLRIMVEQGPLVDGVTSKPNLSVDGMPFERYVEPLSRIAQLPWLS